MASLTRRSAETYTSRDSGLEIHVAVPNMVFRPFHPDTTDTITSIEKIAKGNAVRYKIEEQDSPGPIVRFRGAKKEQINNVSLHVSELLIPRSGQKALWKPAILVATPSAAHANLVARMNRTSLGFRPSLDRSVVRGNSSSAARDDLQANHAHHVNTIEKKVSEALQNLCMVPSRLRMRVQFGTFHLREWDNAVVTCKLEELRKNVSECGRRGSTRFEQSLGNQTFHNELLGRILDLSDRYEPEDPRAESLEDFQPSYLLVLVVKGLVIHSPVDVMKGKTHGRYVFGPLVGYRREVSQRAFEVGTICLESALDWRLEILNEVDCRELPFTATDLQKHVQDQSGGSIENGDVPRLHLQRDFSTQHGVEKIIWRTTRTFQDIEQPYRVSCSLNHTWNSLATTIDPHVDTSAELFSDDWDLMMADTSEHDGGREWGAVMDAFFPNTNSGGGLEALISSTENMRRILGMVQKDRMA